MAYSESLADRIRQSLHGRRNIVEKKMFGGVGFLLRGNMLVGVWQASLIARVGLEGHAAALQQPHVREFDVTGRPMRGWVMIDPHGTETDQQLAHWVDLAAQFVETLPAK